MAVRQVRSCDACAKDGTKSNPILSYEVKRSDGMRSVGEMCVACMARMEREFNLTTTEKRRRTTFRVYETPEEARWN